MASQTKSKKPVTSKKKVIRFKPKINLLKHLNLVLLVAGFVTSLITVFAFSTNTDRYDTRSRGQVKPTVTVTITPSPQVSPTEEPK